MDGVTWRNTKAALAGRFLRVAQTQCEPLTCASTPALRFTEWVFPPPFSPQHNRFCVGVAALKKKRTRFVAGRALLLSGAHIAARDTCTPDSAKCSRGADLSWTELLENFSFSPSDGMTHVVLRTSTSVSSLHPGVCRWPLPHSKEKKLKNSHKSFSHF